MKRKEKYEIVLETQKVLFSGIFLLTSLDKSVCLYINEGCDVVIKGMSTMFLRLFSYEITLLDF